MARRRVWGLRAWRRDVGSVEELREREGVFSKAQ